MLPIKEDEKFSKLVTKESSISNPSFRVYYGGNSVAVPFVWEAKPGTPKHTKHVDYSKEENIPPLTPPPSYYLKQPKKLPSNNGSKRFSSKIFLGSLFPKSLHKRQVSSASSSSSSTLSCPSSSMLVSDSSTMRSTEESRSLSLSLSRGKRRTLSSPGSLFDFLVNGQEEDEHEDMRSPRSILCFGLVGSRRIRSC
ncbi:uncharacterized protein LOC110690807 [Chenopodium quinoa]|uniref:uncharacterized protein LOC110690807 n=1 Tax=Chenopodium quinoa TaxID=63459 RepID=UPI000B76CC8A|nr:uncharacterized protein LOC110690807 [Chenopodium quinoa]